jgi:hypothetical protein
MTVNANVTVHHSFLLLARAFEANCGELAAPGSERLTGVWSLKLMAQSAGFHIQRDFIAKRLAYCATPATGEQIGPYQYRAEQ